jgi:hypothetical protein
MKQNLFERWDTERSTDPAEPEKNGALEDQPRPAAGSDGRLNGNGDLAAQLESVTGKAIRKTDEILDMPIPDAEHASFGVVLRAQTSAANTVLGTQVKVDENRLRAATVNRLPELLERLQEEFLLYELRREEEEGKKGDAG